MNCSYYQTHIDKKHHLFLVGALKFYEHMCFDRTIDAESGLFEFFVPQDQEAQFLKIMERMKEKNIVTDLKKMDNRLSS